MPKELISPEAGVCAFREVNRIPLQSGQVRVRSHYGAAKHGTEMALFKGYANQRGYYDTSYKLFVPQTAGVNYPVRLGNMCVGEVVEKAPDVTTLAVGDLVFNYGALAEEHVWKSQSTRKLPAQVSWQSAVCLDPADFALGAVRDGHVRIGDAVAVFGLGAIGLLVVQIARLAGAAPIIAVDPIAHRRQLALATGAHLALDPARVDAGWEIKEATQKRGADVCIEYSGHHLALQAAIRGVAYGGTVVAGAWPGAYPAGLDFGAEAHMNRPKLIFSRACSEPNPDFPNWDEGRLVEVAWRLLASGAIVATEAIVQPVVAFADLLTAYPQIASQPADMIKLGVRFPH